MDFHAHSEPFFFHLKILDKHIINSFYAAQFMFSYYHQLLPPLFLDLFVTSRHIHNYYNNRISSHFRSHACRTNTKQFTILFQGPKIWNSLSNSITSICILQSLKRKLLFFVISIMLLYPPLLCVDLLLLLNIVVTRGPPRTSLVVS